jgi:hypothetical protein
MTIGLLNSSFCLYFTCISEDRWLFCVLVFLVRLPWVIRWSHHILEVEFILSTPEQAFKDQLGLLSTMMLNIADNWFLPHHWVVANRLQIFWFCQFWYFIWGLFKLILNDGFALSWTYVMPCPITLLRLLLASFSCNYWGQVFDSMRKYWCMPSMIIWLNNILFTLTFNS